MSAVQATASLSKIRPWNNNWTVQVKVLHAWKQYTPKTGETLQMVLSDEEGVKIHASCKKTYLPHLERHCRVGMWIFVSNFTLGTPFSGSRLTKHVYKMSFITTTKITRSPLQIDDIYLDLVDFDTLLSGTHEEDILIDVIGEVLDLGEVRTLPCAGKEKKKVEFTLRDMNDQRTVYGENLLKCLILRISKQALELYV